MKSECPDKDRCGSCSWSHIPYDKQLAQKLADINGSFALKELELQCKEILPSPQTSHYRNRMDFVINFEGLVGLREKGKWWRVIDGHTCFIADERIEQLFHAVRTWTHNAELSYFDRKRHHGFLRYAVIRSSSLGETMINIVTSAPSGKDQEQQAQDKLSALAEGIGATTVLWSINHTVTDVSFGDEIRTIAGSGYIEEQIGDYRYRITPNAFFQTNPSAARLLMETVLEFAGSAKIDTALDLYCGSGFFSIPLSQIAARVVGVEVVEEAVRDARVNAELNRVEIEFHDARTEKFDWQQYNPDLLILDPPRSGMHDDALRDVVKSKPKRIVYVSCNHKHFAREMQTLGEIYQVSEMCAIDMFPHTPHVELVSLLTR